MYANKQPVYICAPRRTAIGSYGGTLAALTAPTLGAKVIEAVMAETKLPGEAISEVMLGCVIQGGVGQAPARQAAIAAGLPKIVQAQTVNKVCSSGLKAVMLASNAIELGQGEAIIAGGFESMSQAPYYLPALRNGARLGHTKAEDALIRDGLWDPYANQHMGNCAELCAREFTITREQQDAFALESYARANAAIKSGAFKSEIVSIEVNVGKETVKFDTDEEPGKIRPEKVPGLKPVFDKNGSVTAANASSLSDGASAMLVCSEAFVKQHKLTPVARIIGQGWHAQEPEWFTTAPIGAIQNLLKALGKSVKDIDLFEINEAFSAVALACQSSLEIPGDRLNINGGAVALGHPLGASGARILTTLIHALRARKGKLGVAALCNGGGEATSLAIEIL